MRGTSQATKKAEEWRNEFRDAARYVGLAIENFVAVAQRKPPSVVVELRGTVRVLERVCHNGFERFVNEQKQAQE